MTKTFADQLEMLSKKIQELQNEDEDDSISVDIYDSEEEKHGEDASPKFNYTNMGKKVQKKESDNSVSFSSLAGSETIEKPTPHDSNMSRVENPLGPFF